MVQDVKDAFEDAREELRFLGRSTDRWLFLRRIGCLNTVVTASNFLIEALAQNDSKVTFLALSHTRAGEMKAAATLLERMPQYNVVTWTTMVLGYSRNGDAVRAVQVFFREMTQRNIVSWNSILQALLHDVISWTSLAAKFASKPEFQDEVRNLFQRTPERDIAACSALIAAYAHSGQARASLELFWLMDLEGRRDFCERVGRHGGARRGLLERIGGGHSHHGHGNKVFLELLPEMVLQIVHPDSVTLTSCAYSHVGLLDGGLEFLGRIPEDFGMQATLDKGDWKRPRSWLR
ncbi:pentatricopeptide repeat-containing protein At2g35030, mitochondrial-like [Selaginella moellendorffii]|uniref:pentatricopeptide repeat-containing protein At2g35030, mitochondrial-like n=1 Tax=Selaginella moellendorffii TaxID=88036 RepID=UPI000D1CAEAF|nr:pentatricopeptide repeat-containing protein At2g35030, mitochondrial-like [Selaginella moellendorffii]|eukprot:XP_024532782.1 pentatricopeptide repeat-containing protein At2g35030, mitochondrial-like [Selaginella moellendorffii]